MFSLQRLLGREKTFFDLLELSAATAVRCGEALLKLLEDPNNPERLKELKNLRKECKKTSESISELVVNTFVTTLEREDIEALAAALYKISKPIEKFSERFVMAHRFVPDMDFTQQSKIVQEALLIALQMVRELRKGNNLEFVRSLNAKLQQAEAHADDLENSLLQELYGHRNAALRIIIIKDLYELLEKTVDRCRDVGNVVTNIVLKNS
jgi:uncharacterized protein Yka (UPF0111/DUF47 family)